MQSILPSPSEIASFAAWAAAGAAWSLAARAGAGGLQARRGWRTGYTRKLAHAAIFGAAALCAGAEAVSPHGWDHAVLHVVPAACVAAGRGGGA